MAPPLLYQLLQEKKEKPLQHLTTHYGISPCIYLKENEEVEMTRCFIQIDKFSLNSLWVILDKKVHIHYGSIHFRF